MDSKEVDELNSLYGDETTGLDKLDTSGVGNRIPFYKWWFFQKMMKKATVILSVASFEYSIGS